MEELKRLGISVQGNMPINQQFDSLQILKFLTDIEVEFGIKFSSMDLMRLPFLDLNGVCTLVNELRR